MVAYGWRRVSGRRPMISGASSPRVSLARTSPRTRYSLPPDLWGGTWSRMFPVMPRRSSPATSPCDGTTHADVCAMELGPAPRKHAPPQRHPGAMGFGVLSAPPGLDSNWLAKISSTPRSSLTTLTLWERPTPSPASQPRRAFQSCTNSERLHSGRGGFAESKIQPLLRDQCLGGQFGPPARTCQRYHGLFSPGSRPTASSQTLSAIPTGLRARWVCGLMVLGTTKCLHDTCNGRFSSALRSPWSLRRAQ